MTSPTDTGLQTLGPMLDEMREAPEIVRPSAYWEHLVELNMSQLAEDGFAEFKRTINRNYFQWMQANPLFDQYQLVLRRWLERPHAAPLRAHLVDGYPQDMGSPLVRAVQGRSYAFYVAGLHDLVRRHDALGVLDALEEPSLGHPVAVRHRGRDVSEDLCNSALELNAIAAGLPGGALPAAGTVVELGGGYGRFAWALMRMAPGVRFVMVDIPPALAVAERYLTTLLPERRTFRFRRFDDAGAVAAELRDAQLVFLTPNQLDLLRPLGAEMFVNISSLHEMRHDQIGHYLNAVGRHCAGHFYTKQWLRHENERDGIVVRREDYPIPAEWQAVFDRRHPIQRQFFEALYKLP